MGLIGRVSELLNVERWKVEKAFERGTLQTVRASFPEFAYVRSRRRFAGFEKGTLIVPDDGVVVPGFPKTERALMLGPALRDRFGDVEEVVVEEKMNGHNVRVFELDGEVYAVTRGGLICPYTTHRIRELHGDELLDFLHDHPDVIVCGEFVGKENPYVSVDYPEASEHGVGFFVFDLMDPKTGDLLPFEEKKTVDGYGLNRVRVLGRFPPDDPEPFFDVVRELDEDGREGIVIKDPDAEVPPLKYTTHSAHVEELRWAFRFAFDLGRDFILTRTIREGFQALEWGEDREELERRAVDVGRALIEGMVEGFSSVLEEGEAYEEVEISFGSRRWLELYSEFVKRVTGGTTTVEEIGERNGRIVAVVRKRYPSTTDRVSNVSEGGIL